jgi:putative lipoic acid-binding regulatory protein
MTTDSLLEFPCDFPLKVMGRAGPDFEATVIAIVRKHAPDLAEGAISIRASSGGNYTALSFVLRANSREQLDALYHELTACPLVSMAL